MTRDTFHTSLKTITQQCLKHEFYVIILRVCLTDNSNCPAHVVKVKVIKQWIVAMVDGSTRSNKVKHVEAVESIDAEGVERSARDKEKKKRAD